MTGELTAGTDDNDSRGHDGRDKGQRQRGVRGRMKEGDGGKQKGILERRKRAVRLLSMQREQLGACSSCSPHTASLTSVLRPCTSVGNVPQI